MALHTFSNQHYDIKFKETNKRERTVIMFWMDHIHRQTRVISIHVHVPSSARSREHKHIFLLSIKYQKKIFYLQETSEGSTHSVSSQNNLRSLYSRPDLCTALSITGSFGSSGLILIHL